MAAGSVLARKVATFGRQPVSVLLLLVPVWAGIGLASAFIALVPLKRFAHLLGRNLGAVSYVPLASPRQVARARLIGRSIGIAARYAPFRSNCYPQALVACVLCRLWRLPYALCFGACVDPAEGLKAHAWVASGAATVTGGASSFAGFRTLACFVAQPQG